MTVIAERASSERAIVITVCDVHVIQTTKSCVSVSIPKALVPLKSPLGLDDLIVHICSWASHLQWDSFGQAGRSEVQMSVLDLAPWAPFVANGLKQDTSHLVYFRNVLRRR